MREIVASGHGLIVGYYLGIALILQADVVYVTHKRIFGRRLGAALFFVGCALHHLDMAIHAGANTPMQFTAVHHAIPVLMQVVGAPVFIWAVAPDVREVLPRLDAAVTRFIKRLGL